MHTELVLYTLVDWVWLFVYLWLVGRASGDVLMEVE